MANHSSGSGGSDATPDQRRRHSAPTIDLQATELPASGQEAAPPIDAPPAPDTGTASGEEPAVSAVTTVDTAPEVEAAAAATDLPLAEAPPEGPPAEPPVAAPPPEPRKSPLAAAAMAGAATAAVVVLLAGAAAYVMMPHEDLGARIAQSERGLADLAARPPRVPAALADLPARLAKIEQVVSAEPGVAQRLADLGKRGDATAAAITETQKRLDAANKSIADLSRESSLETLRLDRTAITGLDARLKDQDAALKAQQADIAKLAKTVALADPAGLRAVRFALLADALRANVERGAPYAAELAAVRPLTDAKALEPLVSFAAAGLPSAAALAIEFAALTSKLMPNAPAAAPASSASSFLDKLQANAERLVKVRPAAGDRGDDVADVAARIEAKAGKGDLAGALLEAPKLPADARAVAEPWIKKVQAREAARAAAHVLAQKSLAAVAAGPSQGSAP